MSFYIGSILGSLTITFLVYSSVKSVISKKMDDRKSAIITAFLISLLIILLITTFTMGTINGLISYSPTLLFWLIVDYVKLIRGKEKEKV